MIGLGEKEPAFGEQSQVLKGKGRHQQGDTAAIDNRD